MKNELHIIYKNGREDIYSEVDIDCHELTIKGHASAMIDVWKNSSVGVYKIDHYNAVLLNEVISIRVI